MDIHKIYKLFITHFRSKRMEQFATVFSVQENTRILDVGGYEYNWTLINRHPQVILVNLEDEEWERGQFRKVKGDGRRLQISNDSFDIAYSNSVIEHVGNWNDQ